MSAPEIDDGPAFPVPGLSPLPNGEFIYPIGGMTLRDYFAAAALSGGLEQGVESDMGGSNPYHDSWWHPPGKIAARAYAIADAMLRARKVRAMRDKR